MRKNIRNNLYVIVLYWGVSHVNYLIFHNLGILPMPVWPAASIAFIAAYYFGWKVSPGIALGAIAANYFSLGSSFIFACMISIMNTIGPTVSALLIKKYEHSAEYKIRRGVFLLIFLGAILTPVLTATGGIGSKFILGLIPVDKALSGWLKWALAHMTGTLIIAGPFFAIKIIHHSLKGDRFE